MAGRISKPLQSLTSAAKMVSAGNSIEIPVMKGIKDIEILSASMREMVLSLSKKETQLGEMEMLAYRDGLTGLPNRISILLYMEKLKKEQDLKGHTLTFLFFDLDGFKAVNDSFGHHTGDLLIKQAAVRIRKTLRQGDCLCRLGGDEFVAAIEHEQKQPREKAGQLAQEVISVLNRPFIIEGQLIQIGCSIGGAI
ncbi:diguanylate cyclase (GGDEF) domain-containing protein [Bacillus sp. OV322]|nr:diguanylate cyclase (GGDEF) domain-containing protein [Bacillus sp. OV322]